MMEEFERREERRDGGGVGRVGRDGGGVGGGQVKREGESRLSNISWFRH